MKNKKGFTLIELIAVLAVLGILLMMAVPNIINLFNNKKEDLYNKTILELERISRQYLLDNPNLYSTIEKDGYVNVNIDDLCTADLIECPISDPRDNSEIKGYIRISEVNGDYVYIYTSDIKVNVELVVNLNGGSDLIDYNANYEVGTEVTLQEPTKAGYIFSGWQIARGNSKLTGNSLIIGSLDTEIKAKWIEATYVTLTFNANGGTVNKTETEVKYSETYSDLPTPTKVGYTFDGWYIGATKINNGDTVKITRAQTAKAEWIANTYTINYELNSGTHGNSHPTTGTFDKVITIDNPTRNEYVFTGWTVTSGLNTETAKYGTTNTTVTNAITSDTLKIMSKFFMNLASSGTVTLTANFRPNAYTLRLNANGGSVTPTEIEVIPDDNYSGLPTPTRDGYTFKGWFIETIEIKNGDIVTLTSNAEATAKWEANTYLVTLNVNEGSVSPTEINVIYGETYKDLPTPIRNGYQFLGWYTEEENGKLITNETIFNIASNQGLYARWVKYEFDYTGTHEEFIAPYSGYYKLEAWGAQGGHALDYTNSKGGYGGYSTGVVYLEENDILNVVVGGMGESAESLYSCQIGGYNGGGYSCSDGATSWGAGGGATHIAKRSGLLHTLSSYVNDILIVAGGGGGGGKHNMTNQGGHGGGYIGNNGNGEAPGSGGTQTSGGAGSTKFVVNGGFGYGGGADNNNASGGGAGLYGGGTGYTNGSSGGGGSGYIGNSLLTNKVMYCYKCSDSTADTTKTISTTNVSETPTSNYAKTGEGFAKVTYLGKG